MAIKKINATNCNADAVIAILKKQLLAQKRVIRRIDR